MTCNITNTPFHPEPLPLYQRDPETASIISSAPSYHSEAPTYTSRRQSTVQPPPQQQFSSLVNPGPASHARNSGRTGLPSPRYAPGYESRAQGSMSDIELHRYNIPNWSSINTSHASRQIHAVANRRVSAAARAPERLLANATHTVVTGPGLPTEQTSSTINLAAANAATTSTPASASSSHLPLTDPTHPNLTTTTTNPTTDATTTPTTVPDQPSPATPLHPHEDPALVGESAAATARAQRLYREMCLRSDPMAAALRHESQMWDFMLAQTADWEQRRESWQRFRANVGGARPAGGAAGAAVSSVAGRVRFGLGLGGGRKLLAKGGGLRGWR